MENKKNMIIWFLIVIIVVAVLVFITINREKGPAEPGKNMANTEQIESVKITILQEGAGSALKSGDTVAVNYTGKLANGTVFDSNVDPKFKHVEPLVFTVGAGGVIKGWEVGLVGMKEGEKRMLEIAPDYAYGATGAGGGAIPPNATLIFEVELLAIKK